MAEKLEDALLVQRLKNTATDDQKSLARRGKKVNLGEFTRPGWSGYIPHYLFQCDLCKELSVDYPHGFPENQYLWCQNQTCKARIDFVSLGTELKVAFSLLKLLVTTRIESKHKK